jgi:hypothetical protein
MIRRAFRFTFDEQGKAAIGACCAAMPIWAWGFAVHARPIYGFAVVGLLWGMFVRLQFAWAFRERRRSNRRRAVAR